jgi:hypothetical protein
MLWAISSERSFSLTKAQTALQAPSSSPSLRRPSTVVYVSRARVSMFFECLRGLPGPQAQRECTRVMAHPDLHLVAHPPPCDGAELRALGDIELLQGDPYPDPGALLDLV